MSLKNKLIRDSTQDQGMSLGEETFHKLVRSELSCFCAQPLRAESAECVMRVQVALVHLYPRMSKQAMLLEEQADGQVWVRIQAALFKVTLVLMRK